jgi:hypothetical protein
MRNKHTNVSPITRYLQAGKESIKLTQRPDGLWADDKGTIYALPEDGQVDNVVRCGVGDTLSLNPDHPFTPACAVHDYKYSSPAYQKFHSRDEADKDLERDLKKLGASGFTARLFKKLSSWFGKKYWENANTK